jgi:hypothetical protein
MNSLTPMRQLTGLTAGALGLAATLLVTSYLLGMHVPLVTTDRAAVYALAALGFGMCALNMGRTATGLGWTHPITLIGLALGALIALVVVAVAAGWRLPLISSDRMAFAAIAGAGLLKWALGILSRMYLGV